ncbi:hypothetical protein L873DRAFT_645467 [Choiromyces venosus 120613-1]|uniref:Uncharacterized protein n=1 Tax=Choiromyces venosus 120613-1 TaxID=1336337 RepID=A0A3N4JTZ7_9PEZI|nr:hypothetical protein L873DRAFT_645467 [Choiromyces venosus 120613-1]
MIPPSAKLYCGIYEIPDRPDQHIVLERSPLSLNSKKRLPPRAVHIEKNMKRRILRHILNDILPPLDSVVERFREIWSEGTSALGKNNLRQSVLIQYDTLLTQI